MWIVTTRVPVDAAPGWFRSHLAAVTGSDAFPAELTVAPAYDAANPISIGPRDMFLATHWTTAQLVKDWLPRMETKRLFYMI